MQYVILSADKIWFYALSNHMVIQASSIQRKQDQFHVLFVFCNKKKRMKKMNKQNKSTNEVKSAKKNGWILNTDRDVKISAIKTMIGRVANVILIGQNES